ncbi:hypothetical protein ANO14919_022040 [Xylariales sp. No.14919]|nr:hypothetical protein ANO14919_022040 [Xylariales sp. No.14919]
MQHPQFRGWAQTWHDDFHTKQRSLAIRNFGKAMKDLGKWKQSWEDGGGTPGILHLLSSASVTEVKAFCHAIRASNRRGKKSRDRERAVEELVMALLPQHYPSVDLRTRDKRPLQKLYSRMLRGCSSDFVERVLDAQDKSNPLFQHLGLQKLILSHDDMLKRRLANYLVHEGPRPSEPEMDLCFREFVFREPPAPGTQPNMSASMQFALEILEARITRKCVAERWPPSPSELEVLVSIYRRFTSRSRSANTTFLIKLGLRLIELRPHYKDSGEANVLWTAIFTLWKKHPRQHEDLTSQGILLGLRGARADFPVIADRWREDPDQHEQMLIQGLRQGLGGTAEDISSGYLSLINGVPRTKTDPELRWSPEARWRLLRLYCQHVPEKGVDIEMSTEFQCLANQEWSFALIDKLPRENAVLLLNHLYQVNPNFDFLRVRRGFSESIYTMRDVPRRNFNVELLVTTYQQGDADSQSRARDKIDELRKQAAASREQEDRAIFAKAAAYYAVATGDLEVYAKTVVWQQRFIRDPLTVKTIFSPDAVLTSEGVALLSGIALSPTGETTLDILRQRLAVANRILKSFDEAKRTGMKEPSYTQSSWSALQRLYQDVYTERVSRAKKLKLQPPESELDTFHVIWEGITDSVSSIGSDFLSQVSRPVLDLLDGLSGPSLVAASETLLDSAARWRKTGNRNKDQDDTSATMDQLAYQAVSKLAHSDTPMLSRDLIRRVIIEHPEASSWHRRFLSIGYVRALPAEAAKSMLLSFATAVGAKLEEQSHGKAGGGAPQSLIKVSTVKYLAQLLNDADFISAEAAVEVLVELFNSTTHVDVRLACLDALLNTLNGVAESSGEDWKLDPMAEKILSTLDSVVSIAGNINERQPVSAADWAKAEANTTIPATSDSPDIPPLFEMILSAAAGTRFPGLKKLEGELFSRLVLPSLQHLQEQHGRWFSAFLAKHRPALRAEALPRVPVTPRIWRYLLRHQGHLLPPAAVDEYSRYVDLQLQTPGEIQDFNSALQSDAALRSDASVRHWLSVFEPAQSLSWHEEIRPLLDLVVAPPTAKPAAISSLVGAVISQASVLLDDYEAHMEKWSHLVAGLGPSRKESLSSRGQDGNAYNEEMEKAWAYWREATLSLAERLIALVQQKTADADTAALPSTFPLRLWCLPYPDPRAAQRDEDFRRLAVALSRSLASFLGSGEGDMLLWTTLVEETSATLTSVYTGTHDRLCVAVHIGDLDLDLDLGPEPEDGTAAAVQRTRVSVALRIIDGASHRGALRRPKGKDAIAAAEASGLGELVRRVRAVMEGWRVQAAPRDMFLRWKGGKKATWEDICSWDAAGDEMDVVH